jgi:Lrp/AsnC family transcriptional regulator, regulator for asnA, asnC and gidA
VGQGKGKQGFEKIDSTDREIISMLQKDGRLSFAEMAEILHVSPGMIRLHYNRLVENGSLKVLAITNPLRLGYETMAMIGIRAEGNKVMQVAEKIRDLPEVIYLIVTSGKYDILAEVMCRDQADLLEFLTKKLYTIDGVRESETFMHLKIMKEIYF